LSGTGASVGSSPALWVVARCGRSAGGVRCGPCLLSLRGSGVSCGVTISSSHGYFVIYVYIYVRIYIITQTHTHTHIYKYMHICIYIYIYIYILYLNIYLSISLSLYIYIYIYIYISSERQPVLRCPGRPSPGSRLGGCPVGVSIASYHRYPTC